MNAYLAYTLIIGFNSLVIVWVGVGLKKVLKNLD
jgi:Flp pilus assembly pilin Flp